MELLHNLKEYSTDLSLHPYNIVGPMMDSLKIDAAEPETLGRMQEPCLGTD